MADNFPITPGSGRNAATDQVTHSGDTADVQLVRIVQITGAEGSKTVVDLPGDATNGLDVDVTRLPSLPAGTNNIGDVDVLSVVPGVGATNLGKAEDDAHSTGDVGVMALAVRDDTLNARSGAENDYEPLHTDANGALWTKDVNSDAQAASLSVLDDWDETDRAKVNIIAGQAGITAGAGAVGASSPRVTLASDDPAVTSLQLLDDAIIADDAAFTPATTKVMMAGFEFDDTTPDSVNEGDAGAARMSANRNIYTNIRDAAGNERGANVNASNQLSVSVDNTVTVGSHAVTNAGAFAVQESGAALTALQLIDDAIFAEDVAAQAADKGIAILAVRRDADTSLVGTDNDYANLQVDANGALKVEIFDGGGSHTVDDGGGSLTVDNVDITASATSLAILDDWDNGASDGASVSGDVAHDSADAGEPVKLGHKAVDLGANPADVAANDRTNWYSMRNGVPFVMGGAPFVKSQNLQVTDTDGAQTDTAILTAAANVAIMVTALEVTADNANTADVSVRIGFGTVSTPGVDADKVIMFHPGIAKGSGVVKGSGAGIIGAGLSNEDLRVTCEDPAGGSISITVTYFTLAIG